MCTINLYNSITYVCNYLLVSNSDIHLPVESTLQLLLLSADIPYFKQVVIMATVCDSCGHRDNEVKGGTGIEPKGRTISLLIKNQEDLNRDVLKVTTMMMMMMMMMVVVVMMVVVMMMVVVVVVMMMVVVVMIGHTDDGKASSLK